MGMGKQIEKLLEDIDMNVNEFSGALGVRPQRIYNIISRDTKNVEKKLVEKMAKVTGVPMDYFYSDNSLDSYLRTDEKILVNFSISSKEAESIDMKEHRRKMEAELQRRRATYDGGSRTLLMRFNKLNINGKKELLKRASELIRLEEYTNEIEDSKPDMSES